MKFVAFSDLHSHSFVEFSKKDDITGNSRLTAVLSTIATIKQYCIDNKVDRVLFAGDAFHKRAAVDTVVYNYTYEAFKDLASAVPVLIIPGNHDQYDNTDYPEHSLKALGEIENITVVEDFEMVYESDEDVAIFNVPYSKNAQLVKDKITEFAETVKQDKKSQEISSAVLVGHLGISGATVGKSSYAMQDAFGLGDLYPEVFDFGIFGHYHKRQYLGEYDHYAYCGSPLQHNFNDEGQENGFVFFDTDKQEAGLKFVNIPSPKFITVKDAEAFKEDELIGNYVRFQVPAKDVEKLVDTLSEEFAHRIEPQKEYSSEKRADIDHSDSNAEIIKKYCIEKEREEATDIMLDILQEVE